MDVPTLTEYHQRLRDETKRNEELSCQLKKAKSIIKRLRESNIKLRKKLKNNGLIDGSAKSIAMQMIADGYSVESVSSKAKISKGYVYQLRYAMKKAAVG